MFFVWSLTIFHIAKGLRLQLTENLLIMNAGLFWNSTESGLQQRPFRDSDFQKKICLFCFLALVISNSS